MVAKIFLVGLITALMAGSVVYFDINPSSVNLPDSLSQSREIPASQTITIDRSDIEASNEATTIQTDNASKIGSTSTSHNRAEISPTQTVDIDAKGANLVPTAEAPDSAQAEVGTGNRVTIQSEPGEARSEEDQNLTPSRQNWIDRYFRSDGETISTETTVDGTPITASQGVAEPDGVQRLPTRRVVEPVEPPTNARVAELQVEAPDLRPAVQLDTISAPVTPDITQSGGGVESEPTVLPLGTGFVDTGSANTGVPLDATDETIKIVMREIGSIETQGQKDIAYAELVNFALKEQKYETARAAASEISSLELRDSALINIAVQYAKLGKTEAAFAIANDIKIVEYRDIMRVEVIKALTQTDREQ